MTKEIKDIIQSLTNEQIRWFYELFQNREYKIGEEWSKLDEFQRQLGFAIRDGRFNLEKENVKNKIHISRNLLKNIKYALVTYYRLIPSENKTSSNPAYLQEINELLMKGG
jgi:hypothetical protein